MKVVSGTKLVKYMLGASCLQMQGQHISDLESISKPDLKELDSAHCEYMATLKAIQTDIIA